MMRKLYSLFFTVTLLFICQTACAYDFYVDGIYYDITSSSEPLTVEVTYETTSYNSYSGEVVIPNSVVYEGKSYDVTSIGDEAFYDCTSLSSITLPEGLTSIGESAFYGCTNLKFNQFENAKYLGSENNPYLYLFQANSTGVSSCTVNNRCKLIGDYAFHDRTSLTSITLPEGLTSIGGATFSGCTSLTSITLPEGITSIGAEAFYNCTSLTNISLPSTLNSLGDGALQNCSKLTSISCSATTPPACGTDVFDGVDATNCILYVPKECISDYSTADGWNIFTNVASPALRRMVRAIRSEALKKTTPGMR